MIRGHEHRAFRDYLVYEKRFSPHTVQAYQSDTDQFLTFAEVQYGLISVSEIGPLHIRAWMVDMLEHGLSPRAINRKLSCLKTFFRFLLKRGWVQQSPMLKILAPKTGKALPVFVREEHLAQLLDEVAFPSGFEGVRDRMMLELLYMTGLRRAELMGMTPESADFLSGEETLKAETEAMRRFLERANRNDVPVETRMVSVERTTDVGRSHFAPSASMDATVCRRAVSRSARGCASATSSMPATATSTR